MIRDADIREMEDIIINHAGPVGKFVVKKAIADLGGDPVNFNDETKARLIKMVLERSIFDDTKWNSVRKQILEAWGHGG